MSTRVIKLKLLTQSELVKVETDARTFGEFKQELKKKGIQVDFDSAKLIDRASKASFEVDDAVLPAVDAVMFVMPTKSKAGADLDYKEVKAKIKEYKANGGDVPFNYTQATTQELNNFWNSVKNKRSKTVSVPKKEKVSTLEKKEALTEDKEEVIISDDTVNRNILVDSTTLLDLDDEAQELEASLE